jgi:D-alanine-D-alanine ligase
LDVFILCDLIYLPVVGFGVKSSCLAGYRIVAPEGNYDYQHKYFTDDTHYLVPCGLPEGEEAAIQALVLQAYRVLGCRGWGRVDVMIDGKTRKPYLLEINTSPGMTGHSLVPMSAKADGISYEALCLQLLQSASLDATE